MNSHRASALIIISAACIVMVRAVPPRLLILPSDGANHPTKINMTVMTNAVRNRDGEHRHAYLAVVSHASPNFHVYGPGAGRGNCSIDGGVATVRATAGRHGCRFATNGGPFNMPPGNGSCIGATVSDGATLSGFSGSGAPGIGLTRDGRWVLGTVANASEASALGLVQLVTGFNWLVYNATNAVAKAGGEAAPRTAAGVDAQGRLLMLEVDGCEECKSGKGPTMREMGRLLVRLGAVAAVNLDGGGSSTAVARAGDARGAPVRLLNHPTCNDTLTLCERNVTSVLCVT